MKNGENAVPRKGKRVCRCKNTGRHSEQQSTSGHAVGGGTMSRGKAPVEGGGQIVKQFECHPKESGTS